MAKYDLCDRYKEPSILGQVDCVKGQPWICPDCACWLFSLPPERAKMVKQTLIEQYNKEKSSA